VLQNSTAKRVENRGFICVITSQSQAALCDKSIHLSTILFYRQVKLVCIDLMLAVCMVVIQMVLTPLYLLVAMKMIQ